MLNGLFKHFSAICVHNPFEVIILLPSICITLSLVSTSSSSSTTKSIFDVTEYNLDYLIMRGKSDPQGYVSFI